ncbi:MAG: polyprenyl synthetase family protein [Bacteroidales bacterium]|jgi:geranylgeranyl diphosphate synthase type II|nr:polyprenyl synthetase family protein [Bacteroidales bacterium]
MLNLNEIGQLVEKTLFTLELEKEPKELYGPIAYILSIGGKRIRPKMCLAAHSLFSSKVDRDVLYPAIALDVFHAFTLIHDDIMDKADMRRGQLTIHKKWNDNIAILSGDVMSIQAYEYMAYAPKEVLPAVMKVFTQTAIQVCEGQQFDMNFEDCPIITMDEYLKMIGLKTAVLIACSAKIGALIGGASEEEAQALYDFGYQLGIAFQITDDYLDVYADPNVFGKNIGGDITNNKKSWLLVKTMKDAQGEDKEELNAILALSEEQAEEKIARMKALYNKLDIAAAAEKEIDKYYSSALASLAKVEMDDDKRSMMEEFAHQIVKRQK